MKRRDLLKYLLAAPAIPVATATASAHHVPSLSEESLERLLKQIGNWSRMTGKPIAIKPTHALKSMEGDFSIDALRYEHRWKLNADICERCGTTAQQVENGDATKFCPGAEPVPFWLR